MLELWRAMRQFEPLRADASVTRTDAFDTDTLLRADLDSWYGKALRTMPLNMLPLTDIASRLTVQMQPDGSGLVALPADCLRVASVAMEGWLADALVTDDPTSPRAIDQQSAYVRGGAVDPVAVVTPGAMRLYTPVSSSALLLRVECVCHPGPDRFVLTQAMLPEIDLTPYS